MFVWTRNAGSSYAGRMTPGGRPPISQSGRADATVKFRCCSEEKARLERYAAADGKSLSQWLLDAARRQVMRQEKRSWPRPRKKT